MQIHGRALFGVAAIFLIAVVTASPGRADSITVKGATINGNCVGIYGDYRRSADHKAFAVSNSGDHCGYGYGFDTVADAKALALKGCKKGGAGGCRVIVSR